MFQARYQTIWPRFLAAIADAIVLAPLFVADHFLAEKIHNDYFIALWTIIITFLDIAYYVFAHYWFGQTVGKWIMHIKVVDISEQRAMTFCQSIKRESVYLGLQLLALLFFVFLVLQTAQLENILIDYRHFVNMPLLWWTIIELVSMLTNAKRRAVHDYLAGSVVVKVEKNGILNTNN